MLARLLAVVVCLRVFVTHTGIGVRLIISIITLTARIALKWLHGSSCIFLHTLQVFLDPC